MEQSEITHSPKERGDLLRKRIIQHGFKLAQVARMINKSRGQFYRYLDGKTPATQEIIRQIGLAIKYDFSIDFPWIDPYKQDLDRLLMEPDEKYSQLDIQTKLDLCMREKDKLQLRTIQLLEELNDIKDKYYKLALEKQ